jgi:Protein of unknown function (DUF3667)
MGEPDFVRATDGMTSLPAPSPHCRNCGVAAPGQYCPNCGQETRVALPSVRELMRDAAGRLVAIDGRLWRTLYLLLLRPGRLTVEYLRGRRKRYVRPTRLFFVTALLMFAVVRWVGTPISVRVPPDTPPSPATHDDGAARAARSTPATAEDGNAPAAATIALDTGDEAAVDAWAKKLPADLRSRLEHFERLSDAQKGEQLNAGVLRFAPYAMVALLPVFALLQKLSYLVGRRRNPQRPNRYVEHLVYGAHLHAFAFLMIIVLVSLPSKLLRAALALWIIVYVSRARRTVYGGTWLAGLLRMLSVAVGYLPLLALSMAMLVVVAIALR